jgi:hypothetical protein
LNGDKIYFIYTQSLEEGKRKSCVIAAENAVSGSGVLPKRAAPAAGRASILKVLRQAGIKLGFLFPALKYEHGF